MKVTKLSQAMRTIELVLQIGGVDEKVKVVYRLGALNTNFGNWLAEHSEDRNSLVLALKRIVTKWDVLYDAPVWEDDPEYHPILELHPNGRGTNLGSRADTVLLEAPPARTVLDPPEGKRHKYIDEIPQYESRELPIEPDYIEQYEVPTAFLRLVLNSIFEDASPGKLSKGS